jgi:glutamyl-tRNA reductase
MIMSFVVYGLNHRTAPLALRERVSIVPQSMPVALRSLLQQTAINEAVILSTCNRTEIYADSANVDELSLWLQHYCSACDLKVGEIDYFHEGIKAMRHLLKVAAGVDSMVLGEPQILGQLKRAYAVSIQVGAVGQHFKNLFPAVFNITKRVRNESGVGRSPVTMAYAAVQLAKRIFSDIRECRVLLVGTGEVMSLMATHLVQQEAKQLFVASRTLEKAADFAQDFNIDILRIADIPYYLSQVDIVISATASQLPIIGKGMIERVSELRLSRPLLLIDLAVPRDIEPEVSNLQDTYLFNVDDLQNMVADNQSSRQQAAAQAKAIIDIQAQQYIKKLKLLDRSDLICQFRRQFEDLRDQELAIALRELQKGNDPSQVLTSMARKMTAKMLHEPTMKLREAAYDEKIDLLILAKELFGLT